MNDSDFVPGSLQSSLIPSTSKDFLTKSNSFDIEIRSDHLLSNADNDTCYICNKDIRRLNSIRKSLHINACLDNEEAKKKFSSDKTKWTNTLDCPMCGEPLQPGPYRAAHAKRCGKKNNVSAARLLVLMETQSKIAEMKRKTGMPHTKLSAPKLEIKKPTRMKEEPRSVFEEQMKLALAMSASLDSSNDSFKEPPIVKPSNKKCSRKSYSFYELEPRPCRCSVFDQLQENFINRFKVKRYKNFGEMMRSRLQRSNNLLGSIIKSIHKLERLERLADDFGRHASVGGDVTVFARDGEIISTHRFIIAARAPRLAALIDDCGTIVLREYSSTSIKCYIGFLASSAIEWTSSERTEVAQMAKLFGPPELELLFKSQTDRQESNIDDKHVEPLPKKNLEGSHTPLIKETVEETVCKPSPPRTGSSGYIDLKESGCSEVKIRKEVVDPDVGSDEMKDKKSNFFAEPETGSTSHDSNNSFGTIVLLDDSACSDSIAVTPSVTDKTNAKPELAIDAESKQSGVPELSTCGEKRSEAHDLRLDLFEPLITEESPDIFEISSDGELDDMLSYTVEKAKIDEAVSSKIKCVVSANSLASTKRCEISGCAEYQRSKLSNEEGEKNVLMSTAQSRSTPKNTPSKPETHCKVFNEDNLLLSPIVWQPFPSTSNHDIASEKLLHLEEPESFSFLNTAGPSSNSFVPSDHLPDDENRVVESSERLKRKKCEPEVEYTPTHVAETGIIAKRLKELGSNVKIIKTTNITPMPQYELMTDKELKQELARFGVRPLGKRKAIAMLKKIYEETHPYVHMDSSPITSRKDARSTKNVLPSDERRTHKELFEERLQDSAEDVLANCTLNVSLEEDKIQEESAVDFMDDEGPLSKDIDSMQRALLKWLRRSENEELHNHLLTLNPISFEEFADRLSRSDSPAATIPKKTLIEILDRLHITFRLPDDGWKRKNQKLKMKKQKK